jgi:hypothetical protein
MVSFQVSNAGEGLQIGSVAASILNKQSRVADKGWSSRFRNGAGLKAAKGVLYPAGYRTPFAVESPFCNTVSSGGGGPKHFPASITNKL